MTADVSRVGPVWVSKPLLSVTKFLPTPSFGNCRYPMKEIPGSNSHAHLLAATSTA